MCKPGTTASIVRNVTTQGSTKIISVAHYAKTSDVLSRFLNYLAGNYPIEPVSSQLAQQTHTKEIGWIQGLHSSLFLTCLSVWFTNYLKF